MSGFDPERGSSSSRQVVGGVKRVCLSLGLHLLVFLCGGLRETLPLASGDESLQLLVSLNVCLVEHSSASCSEVRGREHERGIRVTKRTRRRGEPATGHALVAVPRYCKMALEKWCLHTELFGGNRERKRRGREESVV